MKHRVSSAYYPHSNSRAELAEKSGKKLLRDNMGPTGTLDTDKFMRAVMQFRNTSFTRLPISNGFWEMFKGLCAIYDVQV